jgi:hypothetical protein
MQYMKTQGEVQIPSQYSQLIQSKCRSKISRDFMRLRQENATMSIFFPFWLRKKSLASNIKSCAYKDTFQYMYGAHKGSTDSSQYIPDILRNTVTSWYSQRHSVINHCYRHITLLSDTDISFGLLNLFTYFDMPFG